ncbi:MAG: rhodanese-like domain-containing protein [Armatimonadota bacterium]|nr:rhodanese-like domain-containing protein [Armatimonadota bacterium]
MNTTTLDPQSASANLVDARTAQDQVRDARASLLDVRGFDEFAAGHVPDAVCIPLPDLERRAGDLPTDRPVLVMCQSGGRSAIAAERLRALGMDNISDVQGGFNAWRQAGLPTVKQTSAIPLERQVRIAAGALVLGFSLAGFFLNTAFFYGAALIGFMLTLTGILGICPMMSLLNLLPWNRVPACNTRSGK